MPRAILRTKDHMPDPNELDDHNPSAGRSTGPEATDLLDDRAVRAARLSTIGRLTASLSHEINNPMQALHGALTLALDELDDPAAVEEYLRLGLYETERVIQLVRWMRQVYLPDSREAGIAELNEVVRDAVQITGKELERLGVVAAPMYSEKPLHVYGYRSQLRLVLLNLLLDLGEALGAEKIGEFSIEVGTIDSFARAQFSVDLRNARPGAAARVRRCVDRREPANDESMFPLTLEIVNTHRGRIDFRESHTVLSMDLALPLFPRAEEETG